MHTVNSKFFGLMACGMFFGVGATALQGCDPGDLAAQCGLVCQEKGILEGNASISGIASVDAFFGAVVDFQGAVNGVNSGIRAELDKMALSVGLEAGAAAADIKAAIEAKITASVDGGLVIKYEPAKCEASVEVAASAAAECDVDVDPGSVEVRCEGSCNIDASAQADCSASGNLECVGTAPNLECSGSCKGSCNLEVAASCEGTCRGTCSGNCSVVDSQGNCAGSCDAMCQGSCELSAGGSCSGKCEGECTYTPPGAECEANVQARCTAMAEANVECQGGCEGNATPPMVKAECEATVEAKAQASVECTPPAVEIAWQWSAALEADVNAQAEFKAWINNFRLQFGALLAATKKASILVDVGASLGAAAQVAVKDAAANLKADGDLKASIGAGCALGQLGDVATIVGDAGTSLQASLTASAEITAAVGG